MILSVDEINLLQGQNEGLKKQNAQLQQETLNQKDKIIELQETNNRLKLAISNIYRNLACSMAYNISSKTHFEYVCYAMQICEREEND